ncbi:hypothetical protein E8E13_010297 [Curvularia kusanoi]|uniref:BTB domain-containing protein n=1 Tax=Curvularia kusanoi TaxID=90978 RepID=A0A9P4WA64_CURKU|nr:hypothetical protein E8E13_010297 [Curvularia kusanoi]
MPPETQKPKETAAAANVKSRPKDLRSYGTKINDYSEYVEVIVGTDDLLKRLIVHKQLLIDRSLYFKKALSGAWVEAQEQKVRLPEDDPATFQVYVNLLYTDQISLSPVDSSKDANLAAQEEFEDLIDLYVLAEKLQDVNTKNKAIAALLGSTFEVRSDGLEYLPGIDAIERAYKNTTSESLLRKLIVDLWTEFGASGGVVRDEEYPSEFLHDMVIGLLEKRDRNDDVIDGRDEKVISRDDASPYLEAGDA